MDDTFQFIIESPQHTQGHKKRPRLVTSCDNCRLKKIKCLQPSSEQKCEACKAAKIQCRFRDRERYFAERSRAIAGPNSGAYATELRAEPNPALDGFSVASGSSSPSVSSQSDPRSNSHSPKASGMVSADIDSRYHHSYPPESRHGSGPSHSHSSSISSFDSSSRSNSALAYNNYVGHPAPHVLHNPASSRSAFHQPEQRPHLFDPEQPQRPHPNLMSHFIQVFFERYATEFPFLTYQDVLADFWDQRLSVILANCIAAMASKHSNIPELSARDLQNVAENYIDVAKNLISTVSHIPTLETLHALMLLCWFEHGHHRLPGFRTYFGMAIKMSMDLGLQDPNSIEMSPNDYERNRKRSTWAGMIQLNLTASSYRS